MFIKISAATVHITIPGTIHNNIPTFHHHIPQANNATPFCVRFMASQRPRVMIRDCSFMVIELIQSVACCLLCRMSTITHSTLIKLYDLQCILFVFYGIKMASKITKIAYCSLLVVQFQ